MLTEPTTSHSIDERLPADRPHPHNQKDRVMPGMQPVTLIADEAAFLAARLRRLFQHFSIPVPDGGDDGRLIGCAGAGIGLLLTGRTDGVALGDQPQGEDHG